MKKARILAAFLAFAMCLALLAACGGEGDHAASSYPEAGSAPEVNQPPSPDAGGVELSVATSYGRGDGNYENYRYSVSEWENKTGNTVSDASVKSDEGWKADIMERFENGTEPDVLFFFTNTDSNEFVAAGKVVPVEEIRREYPDYGTNMREEVVPVSPFDGKMYALPTTGVWEGMFANVAVLDACGVDVPGPDYTWEQFLRDCQTIKDAGFVPIGAALDDIPHYWFEFVVYNNGNVANHRDVPVQDANGNWDEAGEKWIAAFEDLKLLYDRGFFPQDTLTASDDDTVELVAQGEAAFLIDGSWKTGYFIDEHRDQLENYTVTFVPGKGERKASDILAGISMGYYITRKAWDDPEKRAAAVDFVSYMTSNEVVTRFVTSEVTALKTPPMPEGLNSLQQAAADMCASATGISSFAQDELSNEARSRLFADIPDIVTGKTSASEAIASALRAG